MKNIHFLLLLLLLPNLAGAAVAAPTSHRETTTSSSALPNGRADSKHGLLKRFSEGVTLRQVKKIRIRFNDSDEKWCSISGLAMGLLSIGGLLPSILGFTGLVVSQANSAELGCGFSRLAALFVGYNVPALLPPPALPDEKIHYPNSAELA